MREMKDSGISWIGEIPLQWNVYRNKDGFINTKTIVGKNSKNTPLLSLTTKGIKLKDIDNPEGKQPESFDTYQCVEINDLVMCLFDLDISAVFSGLSSYNGMISPAYKVLKCNERLIVKYADYWFRYIFDGRKFNQYAKNIRYTLTYDVFSVLPMLYPSVGEQQDIADYLDSKCTQIDTIIAREQSVIEKLQEYKKAIITETIIKGLNDSVERQNQGAVWFHGVPISWTFSELRYVTRDIFDIDHWMPESRDEGIPYLMTGDLESRTSYIDFSKTKKISIEDFNRLARNKYPCHHDIIMARYASIGNCTYVDTSNQFLVSYSCLTIRPNIDEILPMFMYYYFKSYAFEEECKVYIKSNTQGNIGKDNLRRIKLVYPNIGEQALIVKYLDTKCANIDAVILKKHSLIDKLTEYKKSLIYEVVTGKKEVPHV